MKTSHLHLRRLVLVDIENLAGVSSVSSAGASNVATAIADVVKPSTADLTIVGASHHNGLVAGLAVPGARLVWRSGVSGADQALAAAFDDQPHLPSFNGVVIASGDGFFVRTAEIARELGLKVTVIARLGRLSRRLASAADEICLLSEVA